MMELCEMIRVLTSDPIKCMFRGELLFNARELHERWDVFEKLSALRHDSRGRGLMTQWVT